MAEYRNAIRSRKMIRTAFAELVSEKKSFSKITVKEIVEKADISKSTFYCHYDDIDDLINEVEGELIEVFESNVKNFKNDPHNIKPYIDNVFALVKKNENDYKLLLQGEYPIKFVTALRTIIIESLRYDNNVVTYYKDSERHYSEIAFFTIAAIDMVIGYFQNRTTLTLDDIADLLYGLIKKVQS